MTKSLEKSKGTNVFILNGTSIVFLRKMRILDKRRYSGKLINSVPVRGFTEETGLGKSTLQFHSQAEMKASPSPCNPSTKVSGRTAACKKTRPHRAEPEQATESPE